MNHQRFHTFDRAVVTKAGGKLTIECSWLNPTPNAVKYGEHAEDDMCLSLSFVDPPLAGDTCVQ